MTVDDFVESKVVPDLQPVAAAIRLLMRECAPDARETIGYNMPVYRGRKVFAWISPSNKEITLGFSRGSAMEDRYDLLGGSAKGGARHVKMKNLSDVRKPALRYYIKQAVKLDKL